MAKLIIEGPPTKIGKIRTMLRSFGVTITTEDSVEAEDEGKKKKSKTK